MKYFVRLSSFVLAFLITVSSGTVKVTAQTPPYTYNGNKPIYPAVYHAVINGNKSYWDKSVFTVPSPNTVVINNVTVSDGLRLADFTLRISLVNNVVTYQFSNIKQGSPTRSRATWTSVNRFSQSNREIIFTDYFNTEIPKVMENETLYASAKEAADRSLGSTSGIAVNSGPSAADTGPQNYSLSIQNPQNYLLYPAVGAAFTSLSESLGGRARLRDIDCLGNEFTMVNCAATRVNPLGSWPFSYQIKIAYRDNQLLFEFSNIVSAIVQFSDTEIETLPSFDTQRTADQIKAQIERTLANATAYADAKKAFLANNEFLDRAFVPVTRMLRDEFASTLFKDGEIGLNASISDVRQNENTEFSNYTIEIRASLYNNTATRIFASVSLYTNDSSLSRLRAGEHVILSGQFVRMDYTSLTTPRFIMTK
jgi:hypothetical protein